MAFTNPGSVVWRDYVTDGVPSSGANEPYKSDIRAWSTEVETQLSGDTARVGMPYKYSSNTTTNADPGAGFFRLNNIDPALATEIAISKTDNNGLESGSWIGTWDDSTTLLNRGAVTLRALDGDWEASYRVIDDLIDGTTYWRASVSYIGKTGTLVANDVAGVTFAPTGDKGGNNYTFTAWYPGDALPAGGEVLHRQPFEVDVLFAVGLPGWQIACKSAAPEDVVFTIWKLSSITDSPGTQIGTATIASGARIATYSFLSEVTLEAGMFLEIREPDPAVQLSDLTILATGTVVE